MPVNWKTDTSGQHKAELDDSLSLVVRRVGRRGGDEAPYAVRIFALQEYGILFRSDDEAKHYAETRAAQVLTGALGKLSA